MANVARRSWAFLILCAIAACSGHTPSMLPASVSSSSTGGPARPLDISATYETVILGDHPTGYYRLDDTGTTAIDSSGNGYNGTVGPSVTKGVAGLIGGSDTAMRFPGGTTSAELVHFPEVKAMEATTSVSLETWLRFSAIPKTSTTAVAYGSDRAHAPYSLLFHAGGTIVAQFSTNAGVLQVVGPTPLAVNKIYHLVSTFDGTTGRLYVNGTLAATGTQAGTLAGYANYGFSIGDDAGHSDPEYKGTLDEVAVYAGQVLSVTQIYNHYVSGTSGTGVTPTPSPTPAPTPTPASDWATFGYDLQRTGYNPTETTVGVNNVGTLQKVWTFNVGSTAVHEPVFAYGVNVNGQPTNILYWGSQYGSTMYAINASTGGVVWQNAVPASSFNCGVGASAFSIGETPTLDRNKSLLYFADGHNQVHAVDLATGKEAAGWPLTVADYTPDQNFMHGGLTYNPANGMLYAVTGSTCDISPWYGRVVAINTNGPSIAGTFFTLSGTSTQGASGGGIWGPGGATVDPSTNNVFVATGNADTTGGAAQNSGYAEQVVELSPTLGSIVANNYPTNIPTASGDNDFDFGATPLVFQPAGCPELVAAENKSGVFELYDAATLAYGPIQYIQMSIVTDTADFVGAPAFDPATGYVYVGMPSTEGSYRPGIAAFSVQSNCTLNPTPVWADNFGPDGAMGGRTPRSPISIANGVLYVGNYTGDTEFAFNAATGASLWTDSLSGWGNVGALPIDGMVYVGSADGTMTAWALPVQAQHLRKHVVKTKHSFVPSHQRAPSNPWAPWTP